MYFILKRCSIIILVFLLSGSFSTIITQNLELKFSKEPIPKVPLSIGNAAPIPEVKRIQKKIGTISSEGLSARAYGFNNDNKSVEKPDRHTPFLSSLIVPTKIDAVKSKNYNNKGRDVSSEISTSNGLLTSSEIRKIKKEDLINPTNSLKNEGENKITKGSFSIKATLDNSLKGAENNGQFTISSGTVDYSIPDSGNLWVQLNTSEDLPSGAYVTNLQYRLKIDDTGDENNFYCGDYTIWLSSEAHGSPNKYLDVYNKLGGRTDAGYDDDIDDDSDIYLNWRSTSSFNGEDPEQEWCVWIEDHYLDDEGELKYIEFTVEWEALELPNLIADYTPNGWDGPIVASSVSGTRTDGPNLRGGDTTYIDFAFVNRDADITESFNIYLYDDEANTFIHGWHWDGIQQDHYGYVTDFTSTFTAGTHTLEIIADASEVVSESNENDNDFNKSFTWAPDLTNLPNLIADYTPNGWDGPIVASSISGTRTDGPDLRGGDTTYIDFAFINRNADISEPFYLYLYDDESNTPIHGLQWNGIKQDYYGYVTDITSTFTAGTHTLKTFVDDMEDVSESNENDNEFKKSFTWIESNSPDIRVTPSSITINAQSSNLLKLPTLTKYDSTLFIPQIDNKYIVNRIIKSNGKEVIIVKVPGKPPENYRAPLAVIPASAVILPDVPAYDWSFGCAATSAAMIAGYYDRTGYPNMYNGPTNSGLAPMDNSAWGSVILNGETRKQCPISATRNGVDGRTTRGHVDDYWVKYGDPGPDPFINNGWTEHTYESCTGDFMKTSQSNYGLTDGATHTMFHLDGSKITDDTLSGGYGLQLFFESRGYNVTDRFTQLIYGYNGNTQGFTFSQFQQEIDAGRPLIVHIAGHAMVGVGYDVSTSSIYIHDTWDYSTHSMTWGGSYADKEAYAITACHLEPVSNNIFTIFNDGGAELTIDSIYNNKEWLKNLGYPTLPFNIPAGGNQVVTCSIDWDQLSAPGDGIVTIESNDPDENPVYVRVLALPAGYDQTLCVSPDLWDAPSAGGTSPSFSITNCGNNSSFTYSIIDSQSWLSASVSEGSTPGDFIITAEPNNTDSTRFGVITVSADIGEVANSPFEVLVIQDPTLVHVESNITSFKNALYQNYPNPFNPSTTIEYQILEQTINSNVIIKVYDVLGNELETFVNKAKHPGIYKVNFNGSKYASGVYYYKISARNFIQTKKMLLVK